MFQSTRPRGARHGFHRVGEIHEIVSIHAPAGGATKIGGQWYDSDDVSIHAPAGGATQSLTSALRAFGVSIHAPAGGATAHNIKIRSPKLCFNPRARGGRDAGHAIG